MQQQWSPPPSYHATEHSPLLDDPDSTSSHRDCTRRYSDEHETKDRGWSTLTRTVAWFCAILTVVILSGNLGVMIDHARDSAARDQIRHGWDLEQQQRVHEAQRWMKDQTERQANETKRIEKFRRDEQELIKRQEQMNDDYAREEQELIRRQDQMNREYRQREEELRQKFRRDEQELIERWKQMNGDYAREEQELIRRRDQMNREYRQREEELRRKIEGFEEELERKVEREKRERERARVYWDDIQGAEHCLSNGRKEYSARLANLPASIDAMDACKATPVTINGIRYTTPIHCEDRGRLDGVYGHWIAENEGVCAAYWELVKLKDCTAPKSGLRRIEAKLGVVHAGEDRELLCLTTPLTIDGQTYEHPMACPDWGEYGFWGIWNIPVDDCR